MILIGFKFRWPLMQRFVAVVGWWSDVCEIVEIVFLVFKSKVF